ncbi:DUF1735 domain-containing protein [Fulvivirga maritima]|uniref:DUF1735 domain-containing protein n=1 Tax=Fulvivirga maritima TaxID=2904247 RepID=UPI001F21A204|nr:DUF1735 domain-containing protein [Fulvivirga maritima]UII27077.1 DUF1735 domain-containing protein [Fulvivirga maritima]
MKRINFKYIIGLLSLTLMLSSCLDEDPMMDPGQSEGIIELFDISSLLSNPTGNNFPHIYDNAHDIAEEGRSFNIIVSHSGTNAAPEDISVEVEMDLDLLNAYNAELEEYNLEHPDDEEVLLQLLPDSLYSIVGQDDFNAFIPRGERKDSIEIWLDTYHFNPSVKYAIPLTIRSASSGTISGNFYQALYVVSVRNAYDGEYRNEYVSNISGYPEGTNTIELTTTGEFSVVMGLIGVYSNEVFIEVHADDDWDSDTEEGRRRNPVTVECPSLGTVTTDGSSYWDNETETFYLSWYTSGGYVFEQTLTKN